MDTFDEMEGQLVKEMSRIKELRAKVDHDPGEPMDMYGICAKGCLTDYLRDHGHPALDSFFMIESEPALENVDVMTQATTAVTGFTRFTAARSATSNVTGTSK